jgi:lipoprotein signal peptidase
MKNSRFLYISIGVLALDQITKALVRHLMPLYDQIPVLGTCCD